MISTHAKWSACMPLGTSLYRECLVGFIHVACMPGDVDDSGLFLVVFLSVRPPAIFLSINPVLARPNLLVVGLIQKTSRYIKQQSLKVSPVLACLYLALRALIFTYPSVSFTYTCVSVPILACPVQLSDVFLKDQRFPSVKSQSSFDPFLCKRRANRLAAITTTALSPTIISATAP